MKICITGATGFLGRRLTARLADHELHLLTRRNVADLEGLPGVRWWQIDLTREDPALQAFLDGADIVFHCAAELRDVRTMHALHVDGTQRLIRAGAGRVARWVQLSSVGVYGPVRQGCVREEQPLAPRGTYETTKALSDDLVMQSASRGAFSGVILRPSIVFGPGMPNRSLYQLISIIARGLFFHIGPRGAQANYVDVDNVVEASIMCGTRPEASGRIYNLSDDRDIEHFVSCIARAVGRPSPTIRIPGLLARFVAATVGRLPGFPLTLSRVSAVTSRTRFPIDAITHQLGYRHRTTIEDGLARLVEDWRQQR